jgi:acetyltransferase
MTSLATGDQALYRRALNAIAADPAIDVMVPIFASISKADLEHGAEFVTACTKPSAMLWVGGCTDDSAFTAKDLVKAGVTVYRDATPCMRALRAAMNFGEHVQRYKSGRTRAERPAGLDFHAASAVLGACAGKLSEREAKQLLAAYGFPITREKLASTPEQAVAHAGDIGGPVALKIDSPGIPHKTEAGAIRLGVQGERAVREAYTQVIEAARRYAPSAQINGVLVQEMVRPGIEMMLGVMRDPVFGPIVAVGLGGIHVEVLKDIAYRSAPLTPQQASDMVNELRGVKVLHGVRGMPSRDMMAVIDLVVRLSWFAHDFRDDIRELDINPLVVFEDGAGARIVDALIVQSANSQ